ncbi:S-layer homology domain-containing protein [Nostoc sp. FACHB-280]|uniref:S-layer homology domain-containing protein n=1 Tax=Nostoc sp. FACHB-280 TaxID=2692839 RepID=UPI00168AE46E|nr:S-layer homology domain-containing protein [Nostoc sp. FACHB-280]MBD2498210.1 S-layer homology domain-containing protein [Nostoc sp. FACHB-280]
MIKPLLKPTFNLFLGSLTAKALKQVSAIILLCALTTKAVLAQAPSFTDVETDVYAKEIQQAVETGLIAGFSSNNTFRPTLELTREQMVSMVINALSKLPVSPLTVPHDPPPAAGNLSKVTSKPYRDVEVTRWSAAMIEWAKFNSIVLGYSDGTFRPSQTVTRAELMAVLRKAVQYADEAGAGSSIANNKPAIAFSDISNHWAHKQIVEMSAYCGVATPVNETGNAFFPNSGTRRNYGAAATLRMLNCLRK